MPPREPDHGASGLSWRSRECSDGSGGYRPIDRLHVPAARAAAWAEGSGAFPRFHPAAVFPLAPSQIFRLWRPGSRESRAVDSYKWTVAAAARLVDEVRQLLLARPAFRFD